MTEHEQILSLPTTPAAFIPWMTRMVQSEAEATEQAQADGGNDGTVADYLAALAHLIERLLDPREFAVLTSGPASSDTTLEQAQSYLRSLGIDPESIR